MDATPSAPAATQVMSAPSAATAALSGTPVVSTIAAPTVGVSTRPKRRIQAPVRPGESPADVSATRGAAVSAPAIGVVGPRVVSNGPQPSGPVSNKAKAPLAGPREAQQGVEARTAGAGPRAKTRSASGAGKPAKRRRTSGGGQDRYLSPEATAVLKDWLMKPEHQEFPYPTDAEKEVMCKATGISLKQLNNWFTNARKRIWQPMMKSQGRDIYDYNKKRAEHRRRRVGDDVKKAASNNRAGGPSRGQQPMAAGPPVFPSHYVSASPRGAGAMGPHGVFPGHLISPPAAAAAAAAAMAQSMAAQAGSSKMGPPPRFDTLAGLAWQQQQHQAAVAAAAAAARFGVQGNATTHSGTSEAQSTATTISAVGTAALTSATSTSHTSAVASTDRATSGASAGGLASRLGLSAPDLNIPEGRKAPFGAAVPGSLSAKAGQDLVSPALSTFSPRYLASLFGGGMSPMMMSPGHSSSPMGRGPPAFSMPSGLTPSNATGTSSGTPTYRFPGVPGARAGASPSSGAPSRESFEDWMRAYYFWMQSPSLAMHGMHGTPQWQAGQRASPMHAAITPGGSLRSPMHAGPVVSPAHMPSPMHGGNVPTAPALPTAPPLSTMPTASAAPAATAPTSSEASASAPATSATAAVSS